MKESEGSVEVGGDTQGRQNVGDADNPGGSEFGPTLVRAFLLGEEISTLGRDAAGGGV